MPNKPDSEFLVRPFAALRPRPTYAAAVAAPPYDVMNVTEARALAAGKPHSFLHVSRAEIDFDGDIDPYSPAVYAAAAARLRAFEADGVLVREQHPAFYVYRIANAPHSQTGVALGASVAAYRDNRIRRHELTRPAKETDRVHQIEATAAMTGPVMLVHPPDRELAALLTRANREPALLTADVSGWRHEIRALTSASDIERIAAIMNAMPALYIADGHHRSAAAERVARHRAAAGDSPCDAFLAVSFAADELSILDYNRVVADLNGLAPAAFLHHLDEIFIRNPSKTPVQPSAPLQFGLYLEQQWYTLTLRSPPHVTDPVARLDVSVLDRLVLGPLLGIDDPRTDQRIDFIGGSRGVEAVAERVDQGDMQLGFTLHPTAMADLVAVADAGRIMPPKSTWFEPKLADGLLSLALD